MPSKLRHNDKFAVTDLEILNLMSEYFYSVVFSEDFFDPGYMKYFMINCSVDILQTFNTPPAKLN